MAVAEGSQILFAACQSEFALRGVGRAKSVHDVPERVRQLLLAGGIRGRGRSELLQVI
ncbi:MAG: hypothetical protein AAGC66_00230 [Leifsonia sp.]